MFDLGLKSSKRATVLGFGFVECIRWFDLDLYVGKWFYLNLICPFKSYPIECLVVWMFDHSIKLRTGFGIWLEYSE